jgi:hypothetical protein
MAESPSDRIAGKGLPSLAADPDGRVDRSGLRAPVDDGQVRLATRREPFAPFGHERLLQDEQVQTRRVLVELVDRPDLLAIERALEPALNRTRVREIAPCRRQAPRLVHDDQAVLVADDLGLQGHHSFYLRTRG